MTDISIRGLRKSFGDTDVLKGIDLDIFEQEFAVLLGPSGCGKSTLLRLVAGLENATAGGIFIGGRNVLGLEPKDRGCAMVFQNYALYPHMTVADNIGYGLRVAGLNRSERRRRVEELASLVELSTLLDRKPAQLSGGQRQRVAMARALIREPKVFLFDEPLSNLDAKLRLQMRHEVRSIHERTGATSIFVTHDQTEAMALADRLILMRDGNIEQIGTPSEVYDRPATIYVADFIGSPPMSLLQADIVEGQSRAVLESGDILDLPAGLSLRAGDKAVLGIRPEAIRIGDAGTGVSAAHVFTEELGNGRLHQCTISNAQITVLTTDKRSITQGETLGLAISPEDIHVFDASSGRRLAPPSHGATGATVIDP